MAGDKATHISA